MPIDCDEPPTAPGQTAVLADGNKHGIALAKDGANLDTVAEQTLVPFIMAPLNVGLIRVGGILREFGFWLRNVIRAGLPRSALGALR